jgi:hypothetical protein
MCGANKHGIVLGPVHPWYNLKYIIKALQNKNIVDSISNIYIFMEAEISEGNYK